MTTQQYPGSSALLLSSQTKPTKRCQGVRPVHQSLAFCPEGISINWRVFLLRSQQPHWQLRSSESRHSLTAALKSQIVLRFSSHTIEASHVSTLQTPEPRHEKQGKNKKKKDKLNNISASQHQAGNTSYFLNHDMWSREPCMKKENYLRIKPHGEMKEPLPPSKSSGASPVISFWWVYFQMRYHENCFLFFFFN